jgi:hypothetical protein
VWFAEEPQLWSSPERDPRDASVTNWVNLVMQSQTRNEPTVFVQSCLMNLERELSSCTLRKYFSPAVVRGYQMPC